LAVAWYVASSTEERIAVFREVKVLYTIRSKIVHGDRITADEEQAAIALAENYVPRAEELVRRAIRKLLEDGIDGFVETTKHLDGFNQLLALGVPLLEALKQIGASGTAEAARLVLSHIPVARPSGGTLPSHSTSGVFHSEPSTEQRVCWCEGDFAPGVQQLKAPSLG
jgi:hypothetical protein